ncbi:1-deoxy-D-xylulose-5-phosphate reductoisomerase [Salinivibrio sp. IB872]|jgi:1-deoxy-D-xylulose-5-phosphate reductoisomerase|uniref:1-deoxy-D-xylulose-5-phosphate reductoisomerase n=1 Tax=Salinivibrio sp. IB872 TaxID=1766123 RepID=UPI0009841E13|nr:1-deoxy-D-xylulose-5-phosphate reductoisomerase [Salinivibrio sp. IB872]OOF27687.1 1-deoxy-D-xylulose-5-phosphate reductoisomerase [Salinivibrio sp. IB872]
MQKITVLGATGSIGTSTLSVVEANPQQFEVTALAANTNVEKMTRLCLHWRPRFAAMADENAALELAQALKTKGLNTEVLAGEQGLCTLASLAEVDMVMAAVVGAAGLMPTMAAVKAGKRVLLANKEALVMSGQFFIDAVYQYGAELLPIDSEHNAIFQCLPQVVQANPGRCDLSAAGVSKILLTGSGGPFRYREPETLHTVSVAEAVAHPNWSMGPKISVDSATMMNKGLEYIEARWLFNARADQLEVVIHPQSVIHSMVQMSDGSVLAQLGTPDMCTPIAHAMAYPSRVTTSVAPLDFTQIGEFTFMAPDARRYPCLSLAIEACQQGQAATTTLNAANEQAVDAFLKGQIGFMDIARINEAVLSQSTLRSPSSLDCLLELDRMARITAKEHIAKVAK